MSNPIERPCAAPGCAELTTTGRYCAAHANQPSTKSIYDRTKRKDDPRLLGAARIRNSAAWRNCRTYFRAKHPLCCNPFGDHDELQPTNQVHHVIGLADSPDLAFDQDNLRPLCTRCHARVERMERQGVSTQHLFATLNAIARPKANLRPKL